MRDYNFLNLSPAEFEDLSRDVLQKHLSLILESFTNGKDGGIDFRHIGVNNNKIIIQCKRYSDFKSLLSNLKKEVSKPNLKKLNPERYILVTSVGLTPNQKNQIKIRLSPYIKIESDIFGKDDLNNLLGVYPEIEKDHFKLWISSIGILENILHSNIINQTNFEEENIIKSTKLYVENKSFYDALDILFKYNFLIISGIPGVGKTTLARMLVYYFLGSGFKEYIYVSNSISEAYSTYKIGIKQIFFFDDFLGSNFLNKNLSNNEENRIFKFIEQVNLSNDKLLIFTTREYILSQAKQKYEIFNRPSFDVAKTTIDLSHYNDYIKAKILYNHLFFSNIPRPYIDNILKENNFFKIINHDNFNPRIIEILTNPFVYQKIRPKKFSNKIIQSLEYPDEIWKHVYENQISNISKCILGLLMSCGSPILIEDLKILMQAFAKDYYPKYIIEYSELEFNKSIKELENTFIVAKKDHYDQISINYINPSVQDFLVGYFTLLPDYVADIINSSIFFNQLFEVFIEDKNSVPMVSSILKRVIILNGDNKINLTKKILKDFNNLKSSVVINCNYGVNEKIKWERKNYSIIIKIFEILRNIQIKKYPELRDFLKKIFNENDLHISIPDIEKLEYVEILHEFKNEINFEPNTILNNFILNTETIEGLNYFSSFMDIFPDAYFDFISSKYFKNKALQIIESDVDNVEDSYLEDRIDEIRDISIGYKINCKEPLKKLEIRLYDIININKRNTVIPKTYYDKFLKNNDDYIEKVLNLFSSFK